MFRKLTLLIFSGLLALAPGYALLAQDEEEVSDECPVDHVPETTWTCPAELVGSTNTLTWFQWETYEGPCTRQDFATLCELQDGVAHVSMGSNEELISKLGLGNPGYDLATPTGKNIPEMVRDSLLEPIDLTQIPNFANVSEFLKDPTYDPGNLYSVPYQWFTLGIGYNIEAVGEEITSWEQVWNYDGNVGWLEDPRFMLGYALNLLGYDPNTTNEDEIFAARDYLLDHSSNLRTIHPDDGQERLVSGELDIVVEFMGDIYQKIIECDSNPDLNCAGKFAYSIPEEGAIIAVDNLVIPAGAPNPALAMAFMDYILDPVVSASISNYTAYATPNQAAIDQGLISEDLLSSPIIYPSEEVSARLFSVVDAGPEANRFYNDAWTELKSLLGQG
jgi:spermidine/putrescine transport system substrate-binding protein